MLSASQGGTGSTKVAVSQVTLNVGVTSGTACSQGISCAVGDTGPGGNRSVYVFDVGANNKLGRPQLFSDFMIDGVKCAPDGIRVDVDGNLWSASNAGRAVGYNGVTVWNPQGKLIGRIRLPEVCANLTFGGPKRNRLFMMGSTSVYALYVGTQGAGAS